MPESCTRFSQRVSTRLARYPHPLLRLACAHQDRIPCSDASNGRAGQAAPPGRSHSSPGSVGPLGSGTGVRSARTVVDGHLRQRRWRRVLPSVYLTQHDAPGMEPQLLVRRMIRATWMWAGDSAIITGAAAAVWAQYLDDLPHGTPIGVVVPPSRRMSAQPGFMSYVRISIGETPPVMTGSGSPVRIGAPWTSQQAATTTCCTGWRRASGYGRSRSRKSSTAGHIGAAGRQRESPYAVRDEPAFRS